MTVAPVRTAELVKDPRDLVAPEVFDKLVRYIVKDRQVTRQYAERMFGQTLVFLKAYVDSRSDPSAVDMRLPGGATYRVVPEGRPMRTGWTELPESVREAVVAHTGPISSVEPAPVGKHADVASTLHTTQGRLFVKAAKKLVDRDGPEVRSLRCEAAINPHVAEFAPRLHWTVEDGGWLVLGFDHVQGRRADFTPGSPDVAVLAKTIHQLQETPCPDVVATRVERRWQSVTDDVSPMAGGALLHTDLNEDNLIITTDGRVHLVDWAFVSRGAAWVELGLLVPWLLKAGHSPREAAEWVSQFPSWAGADPAAIDLFSHVFAERWRISSESNAAAWVALHASLTRQWADWHLGGRL